MNPLPCDEELVRRLPLPLARLYRRAHNAKSPFDRHQAAYFLWEAALRLLASSAVITFAEHPEHDPGLVEALRKLARPTLGDWWSIVRRLVPILADAGDPGFTAVRALVLDRPRDDLPRSASSTWPSARAWESRRRVHGAGSASASCSTGWCGIATARSATAPPA